MNDNQLDAFIEKIIDDKELHPAPEVRDQLVTDLKVRALDIIDREVIAAMSDEQTYKLNLLLDAGAPDQDVQKHIAESVPNISEITAKTLLRFREAYLR